VARRLGALANDERLEPELPKTLEYREVEVIRRYARGSAVNVDHDVHLDDRICLGERKDCSTHDFARLGAGDVCQ